MNTRIAALLLLIPIVAINQVLAQTSVRSFDPLGARTVWLVDNDASIDSGFVAGTNHLGDIAKASALTLPASLPLGQLTEVRVWFGFLGETESMETYSIEVYEGDGDSGPTTLIYAETFLYSGVLADADLTTEAGATAHVLALPVAVSGTFFVAINFGDYGQAGWTRLAITTSDWIGSRVEEDWELWPDGSWNNISDAWLQGADGRRMWIEAIVENIGVDVEQSPTIPAGSRLLASYPNPFTDYATVEYELSGEDRARCDIVDISGRLIRMISTLQDVPGRHRLVWDGRDEAGALMPSGMYLLRLTTNRYVQVLPIVRLH